MLDLVEHPAFVRALESVHYTIDAVRDGPDPACLAIVGPSGAGKTMVMELARAAYPPGRTSQGREVPFVRIKTPSHPTVNGLAALIIEAIGDRVPVKGSETDRTERVLKQLRNAKTRVLALEDAQHITDHCGPREQLRIADWLKIVVDESRVGLILTGLPRVCALINRNEQLARRFNAPAELPRLQWEDEQDQAIFLGILENLQGQLSRFEMPQLDSDDMAFRCYAACGGLLGYLLRFLNEAVRRAERQQTKVITMDLLAEAHQFAVYKKVRGLSAPFDPDLQLLPDPETMASVNEMGNEIFEEPPVVANGRRSVRGRRPMSAVR